ncbi:MAG: hypothetical protein M0Q12_07975 [Synergistaceae bacterium]|jgi:hypothetical protein|nr:hypothetical protein [Synergistaceae bacterium]
MQLVIKDNKIIATHTNEQVVAHLYPGCECILWERPLKFNGFEVDDNDPRTEDEKKQAYRDKRRIEYPTLRDQLDMIYHDIKNNTTTWLEAIEEVKAKYPKNEV